MKKTTKKNDKTVVDWGVEGNANKCAKRTEFLKGVHAYYSTEKKWPNSRTIVTLAKNLGISGTCEALSAVQRRAYSDAQKRKVTLNRAREELEKIDKESAPEKHAAASKKWSQPNELSNPTAELSEKACCLSANSGRC
ncbi:hypothetical protein CYMTET_4334 [Cymbomonas tetramitiformis]|uniref:Uncharacterized protein n=1 Tax=Cymbomonas tetramitiformis TaxID=36881 RepID=A0AAE0H1S7_9CHLO|nr:hypothetical protein CYMTET_4334 [Cymbomonas tetramitiformis]